MLTKNMYHIDKHKSAMSMDDAVMCFITENTMERRRALSHKIRTNYTDKYPVIVGMP
jgi:hypothetical protein